MARPFGYRRLAVYYNTGLALARGYSVTSATVVGASATLTSSWVRTARDPLNSAATLPPVDHAGSIRLVGYVTANQISAAAPNGIILDQSNDFASTKTGVVSSGLGSVAAANDVQRFDVLIDSLFIRLRYVNGVTVQGSMELVAHMQGWH